MESNTKPGFTNLNLSEQELVSQKSSGRKSNGYFVSKTAVVLIVLFVLILCIGLIIAVYFGHPDYGKNEEGKTNCQEGAATTRGSSSTSDVLITTQSTATVTTTPTPLDIRLPTDLVPLRYTLQIRPDIYSTNPGDFRNNGSVKLEFNVQQATDQIILHWKQLTIDTATIRVYDVKTMATVLVSYTAIKTVPYPHEFIVIPLQSMLVQNRIYAIEVAFSDQIRNDLTGIYYGSYVNDAGETVYYIASQHQVTDARKAFPCMDEPALKAKYTIVIERQSNKKAKSNTEIIKSENLQNGWIADYFAETPPMSTYLIAFLVSDFICVENVTDSGKLVEICARPNAIQDTSFARSLSLPVQEYYEWYHDMEYPLNKTSHVALTDFASGGMENWGLIFYREAVLLFDPNKASDETLPATYITHEVAHMWFGDIVTPYWWDDLWLNEGFAVYMGILGMNNFSSSWQMQSRYVVEYMHEVMRLDSLVTSHPIYVPVNQPSEIYAIFDTITYYKGAAVIRMMYYFLGEHTFRWGISNYLKDREYKSATHKDLFDKMSLQAQADGSTVNVGDVMNTWIQQMGYPVVTLNYLPAQNSIELVQQQFLNDPLANNTAQSSYNYTWMIPVSYMSDQSATPDVSNLSITWLNTNKATIRNVASGLQWIIGNVEQTFYYRVNYNGDNWKALGAQLIANPKVIPTMNRVQILDDAFQLGKSGYIDQLVALNLTLYMDQETDQFPWIAFMSNIGYIKRMLYQTEGKTMLEKYIANKVSNLYSQYWGSDNSICNHTSNAAKICVVSAELACSYGVLACVQKANSLFKHWMQSTVQNITISIVPTFAPLAYCDGIANGGIVEWDFLFNQFRTSSSAGQKTVFLRALGCAKEPWILQRFLEWSTIEVGQHGLYIQDLVLLLPTITKNPIGVHIWWNFLKANWNAIYKIFEGPLVLPTSIREFSDMFSSEWEYNDLVNFMSATPNLGASEMSFQQVKESALGNMNWRKNNEKKLIDWLASIA